MDSTGSMNIPVQFLLLTLKECKGSLLTPSFEPTWRKKTGVCLLKAFLICVCTYLRARSAGVSGASGAETGTKNLYTLREMSNAAGNFLRVSLICCFIDIPILF